MNKLAALSNGFMEAFNDCYSSDYKIGQTIPEDEINALEHEIEWFNHAVAGGEALWIERGK